MLYKLLLFLRVSPNQILLVDTFISDSEEDLLKEAQARNDNNPAYSSVLMTYKLQDAKIISEGVLED